jgi:hypothetical protein
LPSSTFSVLKGKKDEIVPTCIPSLPKEKEIPLAKIDHPIL